MIEKLVFLFEVSFFGNLLWQYCVFFLIFFMYFPIVKIIRIILENYLAKLVSKTKFKIDDYIFDSLMPSLSFLIFAGIFYFAFLFVTFGSFDSTISIISKLLFVLPIVYFMIKFVTSFLSYYLKSDKHSHINDTTIDLLVRFTRVVLFVMGFLLVLSNAGINVSAFIAGLGIGGLAFALAAKDLLKNLFSGIALIFDKTFYKGERVKFEGNSGKVADIGFRTTKVRTYDGTVLTIPNAMLADNIIENVSKTPKKKVKMTIGVTYDTSSEKLREAKEIILKAIKDEKHADEERAWVYFDNFGAYSLDIQVTYYALDLTEESWPEKILFKERINFAIKDGFEEAGIEMAFPTQTIELKK